MIKITADFLINRRKMQWENHHDIKKDDRDYLREVIREYQKERCLKA